MESGNPGKRRITPLERAMRLLSIRSYSERELLSKLGRAGVAVEEAQAAVTECRRRGYLNDELLAEDFAHALSARGSGARLIRLRLRNRGLAAEHVEAALEKTADLEFEAARRALDYKLRMLTRENDPRKKREKVFRFLASRGFSGSVIRELFNQVDFSDAAEEEFDPFGDAGCDCFDDGDDGTGSC